MHPYELVWYHLRTLFYTLVGTRYDVVYKWYYLWNEATVTVTGYPAKLTGVEFHKANLDCCCGKK